MKFEDGLTPTDIVILAQDSVYEIAVQRYVNDWARRDRIVMALIEEVINLKAQVISLQDRGDV